MAKAFRANVIVFEHLDPGGRKTGKNRRQRLHMWKCRDIQGMVTSKAHRLGIRVSHVCAWNTSALAFDGSGKVERGIHQNHSICRFTTGKIYNCDLNASYNIGARYFIREISVVRYICQSLHCEHLIALPTTFMSPFHLANVRIFSIMIIIILVI